jgi:hypothetical protein
LFCDKGRAIWHFFHRFGHFLSNSQFEEARVSEARSGSRKKAKKRPLMQDIAILAGVSRTTVSLVLNQVETANIPSETQERVLAAAKELNYRRNVLASGLRSQKTHTIGFVSDAIATTIYTVRIIQGAQERT